MKIVIYGLGRYTEEIVHLLRKEHDVIAYSDSYSAVKSYGGKTFVKPGELKSIEFDYVIVTIADRKQALRISGDLFEQNMVPKEKIIPFFVYSHKTDVDCRLFEMRRNQFQGVILGNSHAKYGIDETLFPHKFINLALRSQDLYCNRVICEMLEKQQTISKFLRYAILDLFDYNTLNIDNSRGGGFFEYINLGGMIVSHNYDKNKCFEGNFQSELYRQNCMDIHEKIIDELFYNVEPLYKELYDEGWRGRVLKNGLEEKNIVTPGIYRRNEDTINENKRNLREMVQCLRRINPNMKIYFTIIPRFETMEKVMERLMPSFWKKELEREVLQICKDESCTYLNYKECFEIYGNKNFYMDACHLNSIGAKAFTYKLLENL